MNIFVLDTDPVKNAEYHNDTHTVKMILESAQLLMSSYHITGSHAQGDDKLYKLTHKNHPCTKWVNESILNWDWLLQLTFELNTQWKTRFNHNRDHLSVDKLNYIISRYGLPKLDCCGQTPFVQVMPDDIKCDDTVTAYRNYYIRGKRHIASWRNSKPFWYK